MPTAKVVVSKPPKFTHTMRIAMQLYLAMSDEDLGDDSYSHFLIFSRLKNALSILGPTTHWTGKGGD